MLLSSGVVWRHRSLDDFRDECPGRRPRAAGRACSSASTRARVARVARRAGRRARDREPAHGRRALRPARAHRRRSCGRPVESRLGEPLDPRPALPVVLATGGFGARARARRGSPLRGEPPGARATGSAFARARGAAIRGRSRRVLRTRCCPLRSVDEQDFVRAAQLYGRFAVALDDDGRELRRRARRWSEVELPQALARAGGRGWLVVDARALARARPRAHGERAWSTRLGRPAPRCAARPAELPFPLPSSPKLVEPPFTAVRVPRGRHAHDRRPADRRARARARRRGRADRRALRRRRRRRRGSRPAATRAVSPRALVLGRIAAETAAGN